MCLLIELNLIEVAEVVVWTWVTQKFGPLIYCNFAHSSPCAVMLSLRFTCYISKHIHWWYVSMCPRTAGTCPPFSLNWCPFIRSFLAPLAWSIIQISHFFLSCTMRLKVRLMRGLEIFLRTGRLWYQKVLVGEFMSSSLPWASSSLTGSICLLLCFPRASLCRKIKSRAAPRETEAMGQRGSSSFSSSRCSPMWSCPSLYLEERTTLSAD